VDMDKTVAALRDFWEQEKLQQKINTISEQLKKWNIIGIVFDITPLAPLVAKLLHVPAIAISNFAWDWTLETIIPKTENKEHRKVLQDCYERIRDSYSTSSHFIKLAYCAPNVKGFENVPSTELGAWLGVKATLTRDQVFERVSQLRKGEKHALLSFGGHAFTSVILERAMTWNIPSSWNVVIIANTNAPLPNNLIALHPDHLPVSYLDLMAAMDCVICKTGYGIVSEAINNSVPLLFTDRASFREHELLVQALMDNISCEQVCMKEEVLTGSASLFEKAEKVASNRNKKHDQKFDGGERAARVIMSLLQK
jgi:UDP:flavonoid glycosyltransferase YjiC (YdhE family)